MRCAGALFSLRTPAAGARRRRPAVRNAASAPPRVAGAERAARSVINKGGARLRARAPSRAFRPLGSLTRARHRHPSTTLLKTTIPFPELLPRSVPARRRRRTDPGRPPIFQCRCRCLYGRVTHADASRERCLLVALLRPSTPSSTHGSITILPLTGMHPAHGHRIYSVIAKLVLKIVDPPFYFLSAELWCAVCLCASRKRQI